LQSVFPCDESVRFVLATKTKTKCEAWFPHRGCLLRHGSCVLSAPSLGNLSRTLAENYESQSRPEYVDPVAERASSYSASHATPIPLSKQRQTVNETNDAVEFSLYAGGRAGSFLALQRFTSRRKEEAHRGRPFVPTAKCGT
jgi:hypothetical protein